MVSFTSNQSLVSTIQCNTARADEKISSSVIRTLRSGSSSSDVRTKRLKTVESERSSPGYLISSDSIYISERAETLLIHI